MQFGSSDGGRPIATGNFLKPDIAASDHLRGPDHAAVTLVEYGDYQCEQCSRAYHVLGVVLAEIGDAIRYAFRNFPRIDVHPDAQTAAEAAESVAAQAGEDAFWAMHDVLYHNQDALGVDDLLTYAESVGADPRLVAADLASGAMSGRVRADYDSGVRSGVTTTPTFYVNGVRFGGDWSNPDIFIVALEEAARQETKPS